MVISRIGKLTGSILLALALTGCSSTRTESFTVTVDNRSPRAVTLWLTKSGPPQEAGWATPEQVAIVEDQTGRKPPIFSTVVPPGRTAELPEVSGSFAPESVAVLRFYDGSPSLDEILSTKADGTLRHDEALEPGGNHFVIADAAILRVERTDAPPATAATRPGVRANQP